LIAVVRNYIGNELVWGAQLVLASSEVPALCLDGKAQLGWTTWLGNRTNPRDAADLILNPYFQERHCRTGGLSSGQTG
jgi:type VI secretion system protein ImpH